MSKQELYQTVEAKKEEILTLSDKIWEYAELSMLEIKSTAAYVALLKQEGFRVGIIGTDESIGQYCTGIRRSIGSREHPDSVAANLYSILRECDTLALDYIYSESFFEKGLGNAIMNRMLKAAGYHLITV